MGKQNQTPIMQVSSEWKLEKTQEMRQVRQFLKEEGDVDREAYGDGIQYLHKSVRKDDISGEILWGWRKGNFELDIKSMFCAQGKGSAKH